MLKLGIIGLSEGNGHPYSWAAIFNGYDKWNMTKCPFPVIPEYLFKRNFPEDFLIDQATVTHIWTQDINLSKHIAASSKIENVVQDLEDLIGKVDAILLARDDAGNHKDMATPFINSGLPIFIDKPFALNISDANKMLSSEKYDGQIFTCSSLRFAKELHLSESERFQLGEIEYAEGTIMKNWEIYGIHILEPIVSQLPHRGKLVNVKTNKNGNYHVVTIKWENCFAKLKITGELPSKLSISFSGKNYKVTKEFKDSFSCFKNSLLMFIQSIKNKEIPILRSETLELIEIIEKGIYV